MRKKIKGNWKLKRKNIGNTFLKLLVFFAGGIVLIELAMFVSTFQSEKESQKQQQYQKDGEAIENLTEYLETVIRDEKSVDTILTEATWRIKLNEETGIFEEQFSSTWWQQISRDFLFHVAEGNVLESRAVYFTGRDLALTYKYWHYSLGDFLSKKGIPNVYLETIRHQIESVSGLTHVECFDEEKNSLLRGTILLAAPLSGQKKDYVLVLISLEKLEKAMVPMMPDNFLEMRLYNKNSGMTFYEWENESAKRLRDTRTESVDIAGIDWSMEFVINDSVLQLSDMLADNQALYLTLVTIAFLVAMMFAFYVYRPVKKIADKLPILLNSSSIYKSIEDSVDNIVLELEKNQKQDIMRKLLKGYFQPEQELLQKIFPIRDNMWVQVIVFQGLTEAANTELYKMLEHYRETLAAEDLVCAMTQTLDGNNILLLGDETEEKVEDIAAEFVRIRMEVDCAVYTGKMENGYIGISKSYQSAMEKHQFVSGIIQPKYYFPLDWENQWTVALRQGNSEIAAEIMKSVFCENKTRMTLGEITKKDIHNLFHRILADIKICTMELDIDEDSNLVDNINDELALVMDGKQEIEWDEFQAVEEKILHMNDFLCSKVEKRIEAREDMDGKVVHYIETHFHEPDLSLISLQNEFSVSINTVNKLVKQYTGKTFLAFLTYCRMEKAKELLAAGAKVSDVTVQVGYENESSFRRAFQRYTGIKAHSYQRQE